MPIAMTQICCALQQEVYTVLQEKSGQVGMKVSMDQLSRSLCTRFDCLWVDVAAAAHGLDKNGEVPADVSELFSTCAHHEHFLSFRTSLSFEMIKMFTSSSLAPAGTFPGFDLLTSSTTTACVVTLDVLSTNKFLIAEH